MVHFTGMDSNRHSSIVYPLLAGAVLLTLFFIPAPVRAVSYITDAAAGRLQWSFWNEETNEEWGTEILPDTTALIPPSYAIGRLGAVGTPPPAPEEEWNGFLGYYGKLFRMNGVGERELAGDTYSTFTLSPGDYEFDLYYTVIHLTQRETLWQKVAQLLIPSAHAQTTFPGQYSDEFYLGTIRFTVIDEESSVPECCSSVAFFPGLEGSRLYDAGGAKRWEPFGSSDISKLLMNASGASIQALHTADIIDTFRFGGVGAVDVYKAFGERMDELRDSGTIAAWKAFPYDWRKNVLNLVEDGIVLSDHTEQLVDEIEALAQESHTGTVTLIAHSNGGLLAKALMVRLEEEGKAGLVDKVILVAVPQLGTPDAVKGLLHGMKIAKGLLLGQENARRLAETMPSVFGLVPSASYFEAVDDPIITFEPSVGQVSNLISTYGTSITSKQALDQFLRGADGRQKPSVLNVDRPNVVSSALMAQANATHDELDEWQPPEGIEVTQIAGWGKETVQSLKYSGVFPCTSLITVGECAPYAGVGRPTTTIDGDEMVMSQSATGMDGDKFYFNIRAFNVFAFKNIEHKDIFEAEPLLDFLEQKIQGEEVATPYITTSKPTSSSPSVIVSMHSPASIDLYDADGRHTGLLPSPSGSDLQRYEEQIPNSFYFELGESKYAGAPIENGTEVRIQGTGAGTFTFVVEKREGDTVTETTTFADIPVTPSLKAKYIISGSAPTLSVDSDGNGAVDFAVSPDADGDPVLFLQMLKKSVQTLGLPSLVQNLLLQKIDKAIVIAQKNPAKGQMIMARIKQFSTLVESNRWKKMTALSAVQKAALLVMINSLIDNIK